MEDSETIASTDDEILESLIDTFPASDPPAWVAVACVGAPNESRHRGVREDQYTSDWQDITL